MKKKLFTVLCAMLILSMLLSACGSGTESAGGDAGQQTDGGGQSTGDTAGSTGAGYKIGFSNPYIGNAWRAQFLNNIEETMEEYKAEGIISDYIISSSDNDVTQQLNQINQMINAGCDAIVINPLSSSTIEAVIQEALDEGIVVVICNDLIAMEGTYALSNSQIAYGDISGKFIADYFKDEEGPVNIVEIPGTVGVDASTLRENAFLAAIEAAGNIEIIGSAPGEWSSTETQSVMATFLSSYSDFRGVYTEEGGDGAIYACLNAGADLPEVMNGDYTHLFLKLWKENDLYCCATPSAPSIGAASVMFAVNLLDGREVDESQLTANPFDASLVNTFYLDPPYVVTNDGDANAPYLAGYDSTVVLSLDEALAMCEGQEDSYVLDMPFTREFVDSLFK